MQHNMTVIIESQIKTMSNGKRKLFIQSRLNGYNVLETVARDRLEKVDEVQLGIMINGSENDSEIVQEIWTLPEPELSSPLVRKNDGEINNCSQLFITLRSKVTLIYNNILYFVKQEGKEKRKKYQERKEKEKPLKTGILDQGVELDDFDSPPPESEKFMKGMKNKKSIWLDVSKWTANQFGKFMSDEFKKVYGTSSFEFTSFHGQENRRTATGKQWMIIRQNIMTPFHKAGYENSDIKKYIEWAFSEKSKQTPFPLNLGFLSSKSLMSEWMVMGRKKQKFTGKNVKLDDSEYDL